LGILAVALAIVSFVGPWWVVRAESSGLAYPNQSVFGYGTLGTTYTQQTPSGTATYTGNYTYSPEVADVFRVQAAFTGAGALAGVGMVAVGATRRPKPRSRTMGTLFGTLAFVLTLVALLYVMLELPAAVNLASSRVIGSHGLIRFFFSGFWGSQLYTTATGTEYVTYGAGWAWYAVLGATALFLVGSVLLLRERARAPTPGVTADATRPPVTPKM